MSGAASTTAVAEELCRLVRAGRSLEAIDRLYSAEVVSVEPLDGPGGPAEVRGIEAVRGKNRWWIEANKVHSVEVTGPMVGEGRFAVRYKFDFTMKAMAMRLTMTEMALYEVRDGRIVREQFFYHRPS